MRYFLPLVLLLALACNNKAEEKTNGVDTTAVEVKEPAVIDRSLVGQWRPVQVDVSSMDDSEKKELMEHAIIEFTSSGEISTTMKENKRTGTYMYSEQDQKLHTKLGDKDEKFDIGWDGNLLKMTNEDGTVTLKKQ